jgi:hypothetical protein
VPVGPYPSFEACVAAQRRKGRSEEAARRICGAIERGAKEAEHEAVLAGIEELARKRRQPEVEKKHQELPDPRRRELAERWFRQRVALTDDESRRLADRSKHRAFWAAQVHDLRVADSVMRDLRRAIERGESFADWKRRAGPKLRAEWGPGARDAAGRVFNQGFRIETIFRNAVSTAYNHARFLRLREPRVLALRPYWEFVAERPTDFPHPTCTALNGTIRPATDAFWDTRTCPIHHRCQSRVRSLTPEQAARRGGVTDQPTQLQPDPGFGVRPVEGDYLLARVDLARIDADLKRIYDAKTRGGPRQG